MDDSDRRGQEEIPADMMADFESLFDAEEACDTAIMYPAMTTLEDAGEHYRGFELVGEGAVKRVFRCFDERSQREVAYAVPRENLDRKFFDQFIREAWLTASLTHPNIMKLYELDIREDGRPYFTMDLKGNTTLKDLVTQGSSLRSLLEVLMKVCDALAYAHTHQVIHLDLKPDNIQCAEYGEVLVCDWGLAKFQLGPDEQIDEARIIQYAAEAHTLHGEVKGSLGFMAPEQAQAGGAKDHRTDIFALGCLLYYILTAQPPFLHQGRSEALRLTQQGAYLPLKECAGKRSVPRGLDAVVQKALALDPADRYQSVTAFKQDLDLYLQGYTTTAETPRIWVSCVRLIQRNKRVASAIVGGVVSLVIVFLIGQQIIADQQQRAAQQAAETRQIREEQDLIETALYRSDADIADKLTEVSKGIFVSSMRPGGDLVGETQRCEKLLRLALTYEDSPSSRDSLFALYCRKLDFAAALAHPPSEHNEGLQRIYEHLAPFAGFNFGARKRPPESELLRFLRYPRQLHDQTGEAVFSKGWLEIIMLYDRHARRKDRAIDYNKVVMEYLLSVFSNYRRVQISYDADARHMVVALGRGLRLESSPRFGFNHVDLDILEIKGEGNASLAMDYSWLDQAQVKELRITDTDTVSFSHPVSIRGLERLQLPRSMSPTQVQHVVDSLQAHNVQIDRR